MNEFLLAQLPLVLHSTHGDGSGPGILLVAGPVAGSAIYAAISRFYRNADQSDQFERETTIELKAQISGSEQKVDEVKGTRDRRVNGDNAHDYRSRVAKLE